MKTFKISAKLIPIFYYSLFFLVPLVFFHKTSELFEFNKIITAYILTVLITAGWIVKMIGEKKVIFNHTALDLPILFFLTSQIISTIISIDPRTSFFGYYSRFNGGLLSSICYALLYWGLVSNLSAKEVKKLLKVAFVSLFISSVWAILEHFGHSFSCLIFPEYRTFDVSCWVQDVAWRVYSTFGQPNWLAAYLAALIPISWAIFTKSDDKLKKWVSLGLSSVFVITLLFTKSRSGILAFAIGDLVFWASLLIYKIRLRIKFSKILIPVVIWHIILLVIASIIGTPWTKSINETLNKDSQAVIDPVVPTGPALEVGGTSSTEIRKIVWKGAFDIWKNYPIFGTGVESFAFSYYGFRPIEHNLTSEWDYLYNKAHNEYLNFAATTGAVGLLTYSGLILAIFWTLIKNSFFIKDENSVIFSLSILSGFITILITNFFGFSVVPVSLQFFLFPGIAIALKNSRDDKDVQKNQHTAVSQIVASITVLFVSSYFLFLIYKYWRADYFYANGKNNADAGNYSLAMESLNSAISISPKESVYWEELADTSSDIAVALSQQDNKELANKFVFKSIEEIKTAIRLSPANVNLKRSAANIYVSLSIIDPKLIVGARDTLKEAVKQAPTDAKLLYNLGLSYLRTGENEAAEETLKKTIKFKPDYRNAHYALGLLYTDLDRKEEAQKAYEYVLNNIDPNDPDVKRELDNLRPQ